MNREKNKGVRNTGKGQSSSFNFITIKKKKSDFLGTIGNKTGTQKLLNAEQSANVIL